MIIKKIAHLYSTILLARYKAVLFRSKFFPNLFFIVTKINSVYRSARICIFTQIFVAPTAHFLQFVTVELCYRRYRSILSKRRTFAPYRVRMLPRVIDVAFKHVYLSVCPPVG